MTEIEGGEKTKIYLEERKLLIEAEREAARSFDRAMLTLSSGALALSITFIRQIAPTPRFEAYLHIAWGGFIFALLCTLLSFLFSQSALRRQRDIQDERRRRDILDKNCKGEKSAGEQRNWQATITNNLNRASILSFILGVTFLILFAMKNLPLQEETMTDKSSKPALPSKDLEKRGFVPPKPLVEQPNDKPQSPPQGSSKPEKK